MIKKIFLLLAVILLINFGLVVAQETTGSSQSDLEKKIEEYQQRLTEIRQEKNTLSSQIQYMDTQIYLTQLRIEDTEKKVIQTQKEIETLGSRIEGLDSSLNYLTKLLLEKVIEGYKQRSLSIIDYLLNTNNAEDFLVRVKYLKTTQNNNQKIVVQVQQAKINFEEQKKLREEKVAQLDNLKNQLDIQKQELDNQKHAKQKLLADTQNSENAYQDLLARAQRQLQAFKSFVQSSGASSVISANAFGTGDGNYFSQRDERWAYKTIGYSSDNILNVGCLITSVAMSLKKKGVDTNPSIIASNPDYFDANTANMKYRDRIGWPNGLRSEIDISLSQVDEELNNSNYVIVGINYGSCNKYYSDHFVVLTKKEGNDYKMYDPLWGPDINFYSKYNSICWAEVIK